jgi:hypothetical protein
VLSGQKGLVSPRAALLAEEPDVERSVAPEAPDAVRFALPGARGVERFARATRARAVQPAHQRDACSVRGARFPDAAGSTHANAAVERTVSPNGCRTGGSSSSGYCSVDRLWGDSRYPYAPCSRSVNSATEWTVSLNGFRTGDSSWFEYCSSGYWSRYYLTDDYLTDDSRSEGGPMGCFGWANSTRDSQDSSLVASSFGMRSDFHLDGSPLDFVTDDSPPGPRHALAAATSPEHGKCHQQPGRKLRHVR